MQFIDVALVNNSHVISQQPNMTAINSCVEIDLTVRVHPPTHQPSQTPSLLTPTPTPTPTSQGQVVSDSIGATIYSGVGGQVRASGTPNTQPGDTTH